MARIRVRKGQASVTLSREEFEQRLRRHFDAPSFRAVESELRKVIEVAWTNYIEYHKNPRTRPAGKGFHDPAFALPLEWLQTRRAIQQAQRRHDDRKSPSRILVVSGSSRGDQTCPGEVPKSWRLANLARKVIAARKGFEVDFLDLSLLTAEYGRAIHPCKACVSTAMPLCNWPCSCYPNQAMQQTGDWMNELYPRWVAAHGVMIVTPVNWYQAPSGLKLMIDRLVCADGGNPDPTLTGGKDPKRAKELELKGWHYPKHLAGRGFSVVVHADAAGVDGLRHNLCDWLADMGLIQAGPAGGTGAYIGYMQPYATSHDDLDKDKAVQAEVKNAALALVHLVESLRDGSYQAPDADLKAPRLK
ncbi:MAG: flavodoxin family protein [Planctomycetes bacterium]|jgi:multimeric flavodoxin WrbA|nr:flavodoxin family protein [Planctomycetota bacterium]MCL4730104.1 NAD(P)H-dependent oxidoreductase [Planctomycetota bacterium]